MILMLLILETHIYICIRFKTNLINKKVLISNVSFSFVGLQVKEVK